MAPRNTARLKKKTPGHVSRSGPKQATAATSVTPVISRDLKSVQISQPIKRQSIALAADMIHPRVRIAHTIFRDILVVGPRVVFDHEIVLIQKGEGFLHHQGQSIPIAPGSLLFIEPFVPHKFECIPRRGVVQHTAIHFDLSTDKPAWAADIRRRQPYQIKLAQGLSFPLHTSLPANHPILSQITDLIRAWRSPTPLSKLRTSSLLLRVLIQLLDVPAEHHSRQRHESQMRKVVHYLHTHFAKDLSLEDMAHIAGLSRAHFVRLFTQWTSCPPGDYLQRTRIDHARTLLASPDDIPIKRIAQETGFKNPYHFSRVFRKYQGISPSHFRQTITGAPAETDFNTP